MAVIKYNIKIICFYPLFLILSQIVNMEKRVSFSGTHCFHPNRTEPKHETNYSLTSVNNESVEPSLWVTFSLYQKYNLKTSKIF